MSPSTTASTKSGSSFTSPRIDAGALIISCSYPGCPAKIDGQRQALCEAHLQVHAISKTDKYWDSAQANGTHAAHAPAGSFTVPLQTFSTTNPRKLLPETDKDRPIIRRKTAGNPPLFVQQQPAPKHSTPPFRGESAMSPPSARPLAPRPPAYSPPASPGVLLDGESTRKRPKLSPSPRQSPKAPVRVNGTSPNSLSGKPTLEPKSLQFDHRPSNHLSQLDRTREKEVKSTPKPGFRHPVRRRVPLQLSSLRFIDGPEEAVPGVICEESSSSLNGINGSASGGGSGTSDLSLNRDIKDYRGQKSSSSASSTTLAGSIGSPSSNRRPWELLGEQGQKAPPDGRKSTSQTGHEPVQARGIATSTPQPEKTHFPIKPAPATQTHSVQFPKPKEIDTAYFDALIYSQPGASSPPPNLDLTPATATAQLRLSPQPTSHIVEEAAPAKGKDEPLYLDIDPRIHWPQPHSAAWYANKQKEIRARGSRKANFGQAAHSLRRQRRETETASVAFEDTLPDKIAENPAWVRVLRRLKGLPPAASSSSSSSSSSSFSYPGEEEHGSGAVVNGSVNGDGVTEKRGRRKPPGVAGKRVGNSGVVVVTGLNGSHMGSMRRFGGEI
ncbi:hypothetical protein C7999DRAFT_27820 [Corynascus novoguineensis]|uniref:Uncharacterized protein n=1 Tax=Corynascus novoguineensis TaxID=1126955 RepID=A0AAN7D3L4_9PEZI|nr:hypothetical protein C7999DRAFT_27820 [Corynascus novoguineensis]